MSKKAIKVSLNEHSINIAIKELQQYKQWLIKKTYELLNALSKEGIRIASAKFASAVYDGTNDVSCQIEQREKNKIAILAIGSAVLFIEFGTGVKHPDVHPEAQEHRMIHGKYGYKLGHLEKGWRYKGEPGTNGTIITTGKHAGEVHTYGNPANMSLYLTIKELEEKFKKIASKVFG